MAWRDGRLPRLVAVVALVSTLPFSGVRAQTPAPIFAPACVMAGSRLLVDATTSSGDSGSALLSVDPATNARIPIPVAEPRRVIALDAPGFALVESADERWVIASTTGSAVVPIPDLAVTALTLAQSLATQSARWEMTRTATASATDYRIRDRSTHAVALETSFRRRIELSASASSRDGRAFVHLQANNVASEVFIFDAMTRGQRSISIPHDARLAAYAISLMFSPDASCLAISMEREDDPDPDTWIVDLTATSLTPQRADLGYVLAWVPIAE